MEDKLEDVFKTLFQRDLELEINNKVFKRGKFVLYRLETYSNNFEITLIFEKNSKIEHFKIPYPFNYEFYPEDNELFFDYRLITLCNNNLEIVDKLKPICEKYNTSCKFLDKILKINFK